VNPVIYYRPGRDVSETEVQAMQANFRCVTSRLDVQPGELCIARYSAWPWYKELHDDLVSKHALLINTLREHAWACDLGNWTDTLEGLTPRTWRRLEEVPDSAFPVVVKGETNSRKFQWDSHMFAQDRQAAGEVLSRLQEDSMIGYQHVYFRQYVPLKAYLTGFRGLPIAKEFRVFVCCGREMSRGYYWSNYTEDLPAVPNAADIPASFLAEVIQRIGRKCTFYAVDVAQAQDESWTVIDLGDAQMCGLAETDPQQLYRSLREILSP